MSKPAMRFLLFIAIVALKGPQLIFNPLFNNFNSKKYRIINKKQFQEIGSRSTSALGSVTRQDVLPRPLSGEQTKSKTRDELSYKICLSMI